MSIGKEEFVLEEGDFAVVFPNVLHSYQENAGRHCRAILALCKLDTAGEYRQIIARKQPKFPVIRSTELHPDIVYVMKSLLLLEQGRNNQIEYENEVASAYVQLVFARYLRQVVLRNNNELQTPDMMISLLSYLGERYLEPISLDDVASHLGVSKFCASRAFGRKIGISFSKYINTLRIDYSEKLLRGTEDSITTIAFGSGYESVRTFNREFKNIVGMTPREYREQWNEKPPLDSE
jgi:AraC-like DNA-binding protein